MDFKKDNGEASNLRLGVQKSGRLKEGSFDLINECGIKFKNDGVNPLKAKASNFDLEIIYLRDDDIPQCVRDKAVDAGIVGLDVLRERELSKEDFGNVEIVERLGFAECRLSVAVPRDWGEITTEDLNGVDIATSYPALLDKYISDKNIDAEIHEINGSVELSPSLGISDAICDIVSTGSTLLSNGLREVRPPVLESEAVLVKNKDINKKKESILNEFVFRINSVKEAKNRKYILLNTREDNIDRISDILPGLKSPTIIDLEDPGWKALHSVVYEEQFWEKIGELKKAGAQGILVVSIDKLVE